MKNLLIPIILICLCISCKKPVESDCIGKWDIIHENSASIIGKWKLSKVQVNFTNSSVNCYDYSHLNIVYEFNHDGFLRVSGKNNYRGLKSGKYSYSFVNEGIYKEMQIDNSTYWYKLNSMQLIIDQAPLDGETYFFVKE